jgi:RNA polymerase sigma-70 factor (ECF subfamily)
VNGAIGVVVAPRGRLLLVLDLAIKDGKITQIDVISERARLEQLDFAILGD